MCRGIAPIAWASTSRSCWAAWSDGDRVAREQSGELAGADRQRVDERRAARPGELHQGQAGEVRLLAVELGVDGVPRLGEDRVDDARQGDVVVDPRHRVRGRRARRAGPGRHVPVATSWPVTIHAIVPPVTLTTSCPTSEAISHARMLRTPVRQMT